MKKYVVVYKCLDPDCVIISSSFYSDNPFLIDLECEECGTAMSVDSTWISPCQP